MNGRKNIFQQQKIWNKVSVAAEEEYTWITRKWAIFDTILFELGISAILAGKKGRKKDTKLYIIKKWKILLSGDEVFTHSCLRFTFVFLLQIYSDTFCEGKFLSILVTAFCRFSVFTEQHIEAWKLECFGTFKWNSWIESSYEGFAVVNLNFTQISEEFFQSSL